MKLATFYNMKINALSKWSIEQLMKPLIITWPLHHNFGYVVCLISMINFIFHGFLKYFHSAETAEYLVRNFLNIHDKNFIRLYIQNKLLTQFLRLFMESVTWKEVDSLLQKHCTLVNGQQALTSKVLLCTHTGDYWIAILSLAQQYTGRNVEFIVPVYEKITEKKLATYNRISIPGVKIIFINIHEPGVLIKLMRFMKKPDCVVAIFYDLFCYAAGVYNGSVGPVCLFDRKAHMTTGIVQLLVRMKLQVSFASCSYSVEKKKYITEVSLRSASPDAEDFVTEMVAWLEAQLKNNPSQWHFMANLDTYYHFPVSELRRWHRINQANLIRLNAKYSNYNG